MEQRKPKWRELGTGGQVDELLARRYAQFFKWGVILTRGDEGKAEEIVQELCLYFTLARPDLSNVSNVDGYLYTCLRHIYLSSLARSSREAQQFVSVAEFDSFESALAGNRSGDLLERQNDLRRICGYTVWRKESSKTASYFIFHFFHGYSRREIAEVACIPMAAVYNKLKAARAEVKAHLEQSGKLRIINRDMPPEPALSWGLVSSAELFRELRETILKARASDCLSEQNLLVRYDLAVAAPIPCELLAHIVSCDRCLAIIDRHFRRPTLDDREPLDGCGSPFEGSARSAGRLDQMDRTLKLGLVRRRWNGVHEHRPQALSIAVDGKIVAMHEVQSAHNMLSVRIEQPEKAQFVEVFSEQDVRLALLSISELPPEGSHVRLQRVCLSDARWLELRLRFDGLGLDSEVAYFDPVLASDALENAEESVGMWVPRFEGLTQPSHVRETAARGWTSVIDRIFRSLVPSSAMVWALVLTVIAGAGAFMAYRHAFTPVDGTEIIERSLKIEATNLRGRTEHQVLQLQQVSASGAVLQQNSVDLWKDGDGRRYLRRLYDSRHRLIASKWQNKSGQRGSAENWSATNPRDRETMDGLWDQDLSIQAFRTFGSGTPQLHTAGGNYQLTIVGPIAGRPKLVSATLVLDHHLLPVRETLRLRAGSEMHEFRLIQTEYELKSSASVPDSTFDPESGVHDSHSFRSTLGRDNAPISILTGLHLTELQIAVLDRLNDIGADTGEPIEVDKTPDGHIRVSGTVADDSVQHEIVSRLETLPDRGLLDLRVKSLRDLSLHPSNGRRTASDEARVYDLQQTEPMADAMLHKHFQAQGLSGERLNFAIAQYSQDVLEHAQHALQHAYALKRLGGVLAAPALGSIDAVSRREWTAMVLEHAQDLEAELHALQGELTEIKISQEQPTDRGSQVVQIEDPAQFEELANQLLRQTQDLNSDIGRLFTSNMAEAQHYTPDSLFTKTLNDIPLQQTNELAGFAARLNSVSANRSNDGDDKKTLDAPQ
jgi:DNA-directed RNA polymerase specialized sigma24 family protein